MGKGGYSRSYLFEGDGDELSLVDTGWDEDASGILRYLDDIGRSPKRDHVDPAHPRAPLAPRRHRAARRRHRRDSQGSCDRGADHRRRGQGERDLAVAADPAAAHPVPDRLVAAVRQARAVRCRPSVPRRRRAHRPLDGHPHAGPYARPPGVQLSRLGDRRRRCRGDLAGVRPRMAGIQPGRAPVSGVAAPSGRARAGRGLPRARRRDRRGHRRRLWTLIRDRRSRGPRA